MKVLWLCNTMLPVIARQLGLEASNKEGWISGMADMVLAQGAGSGIVLSVAFPMQNIPEGGSAQKEEGTLLRDGSAQRGQDSGKTSPWGTEKDGRRALCRGRAAVGDASLDYYGFVEDVSHPEKYDGELEQILKKIVHMAEPDIVHCFGTEYPHTLALCRIFPDRTRLLLGLQGLCTALAEAYWANLPEKVIRSETFRDWLKQDSIERQQQKFAERGRMEREAVRLAGNVTGRTRWDRAGVEAWNPKLRYHFMNESLRKEFYGPVWREEDCVPRSIFLSQGDYPIKGLHYMLLALPKILAVYPDAQVYVAGSNLTAYGTLREKLKISAYGKYLRRLIMQNHLETKVVFLGRMDGGQMRDQYLKSHLFVCCSAMENSPNSLGEAMLLGMPCVSSNVGGIPSIFTDGVDGILYEACPTEGEGGARPDDAAEREGLRGEEGRDSVGGNRPDDAAERGGTRGQGGGSQLDGVACRLAEAVLRMWQDPRQMREYCRNARSHGLRTHDREKNYKRLVEIYEEIL